MASIVYGTVSSTLGNGSAHGLRVGLADSNLERWDLASFDPSPSGPACPCETAAKPSRVEQGRMFGRYRLMERIGRGRQADVWRALRYEPTTGEVALKILNDPAGDPRRIAQLRREAERSRRLASPALLTSYEFGFVDGIPYMAMPLVVGCTLAQAIEQRRAERRGYRSSGSHRLALTPEPHYTRAIIKLIAQVARAVADAHSAQVVHRDIKPGNILLPRDHESGVFLCDFGLGRDLDVATATQLLDGAGSPSYMAPERLLKQHANEVRCDVYAIGVTLFEALTLSLPFEVPAYLSREEWPAYLATARPTLPSTHRPLPAGLEAIILRAIDRETSRRHPTASHLADDLDACLTAA